MINTARTTSIICTAKNLRMVSTVSYTHLDVYKRQDKIHPVFKPRLWPVHHRPGTKSHHQSFGCDRSNPCKKANGILIFPAHMGCVAHAILVEKPEQSVKNPLTNDPNRRYNKSIRFILWQGDRVDGSIFFLCTGGTEPVSYTHLDVYKRQGEYSIPAPLPPRSPFPISPSIVQGRREWRSLFRH